MQQSAYGSWQQQSQLQVGTTGGQGKDEDEDENEDENEDDDAELEGYGEDTEAPTGGSRKMLRHHQQQQQQQQKGKKRKNPDGGAEGKNGGKPAQPSSVVYVTGLPEDVTVEEVKDFFSKCGLIKIDFETGERTFPRLSFTFFSINIHDTRF